MEEGATGVAEVEQSHSARPSWQTRDLLALAFAMTFPAVMAWVYFVTLSGDAAEANVGLQLALGAGKAIQFAFPLVFVLVFERSRLRPAAPNLRGLEFGLGFGVLVGAALWGLFQLLHHYTHWFSRTPAEVHRKLAEFGLDTPQGFLALAVFISVVHSFAEEYYWRWFVFGWLKRYLSLPAAIALSSAAFMAHHVVVLGVYFPGRFWNLALPMSLGVGAGGAFWAWLYHRSGSLYASWLSHLLIDAAIMLVGYEMLTGYWS
jgi:membrane protease YdiL (CAAX protease family)